MLPRDGGRLGQTAAKCIAGSALPLLVTLLLLLLLLLGRWWGDGGGRPVVALSWLPRCRCSTSGELWLEAELRALRMLLAELMLCCR